MRRTKGETFSNKRCGQMGTTVSSLLRLCNFGDSNSSVSTNFLFIFHDFKKLGNVQQLF